MAVGRPTRLNERLIRILCRRIAEGESLRSICSDRTLPTLASVQGWLADPDQQSLRTAYARAREQQADLYADQVVEISDTEENPQIARLRIDARKWKAAKMHPHVYGDKPRAEPGGDLRLTIETGVPRADD